MSIYRWATVLAACLVLGAESSAEVTDKYSLSRVQAKILSERCLDNKQRDQCIMYIWAVLDTLTVLAPDQACFPVSAHPTAGVPSYDKAIYVGIIAALTHTAQYAPATPAADVITRFLAETYKCGGQG